MMIPMPLSHRLRPGVVSYPFADAVRTVAATTFALALALAPAGLFAQQAAPPASSGIWIADATGELRRAEPAASFLTGQPERARPPGSLRVALVLEAFAPTAAGALASGDLAATRVTSAVASLGIAPEDIERDPAFVQPQYERRRLLAGSWEQPRVTGFHAIRVFRVRGVPPERLGLLVDFAVGAGATGVLSVDPEGSAR